MKAYSWLELELHLFMNSALDAGDWSAACHDCLSSGPKRSVRI
jgi:hypothetical protein